MRNRNASVVCFANCLRHVGAVFVAGLLVGCASRPIALKPLRDHDARSLSVLFSAGKTFVQRYSHDSHIKTFENGDLVREKDGAVDFVVRSVYSEIKPGAPHVAAQVTSLEQDGSMDLRELAFPQLNETMEFIFTAQGGILKAGSYDSNSLFFVPPISLPESPVKVGDTWTLRHSWLSPKAGIPLTMDVVTILKNFFKCGDSECAELEISGRVSIPGLKKQKVKFESRLRGTMLFSLAHGQTLWFAISSDESFRTGTNGADVESCLASVTIEPNILNWNLQQKLNCKRGMQEPLPAALYAEASKADETKDRK